MRSSDISSAGVGGRDPGRATTWRTFGERRGVSPPVASRSRVSGDFGGQPAALRLAARLDLAALVAGSFQHAECFIAEPGMGTEDASSVVGMNSQLSPATSPVPSVEAPSPTRAPLVLTAFWVLVVQSFQRHWRVRQMGWVALGLLGITVGWVAAVTSSPAGWGLENRRARRFPITYREYGEQLLPPTVTRPSKTRFRWGTRDRFRKRNGRLIPSKPRPPSTRSGIASKTSSCRSHTPFSVHRHS